MDVRLRRVLRIFRPSWAPVRFTLWFSSSCIAWHLLVLPRFVRRWVPHGSAVLSISFLYVFAQALGLMWLLVVNLCSVCSVQLVKHVQFFLSGQTLGLHATIQTLLTGYVQYCIFRVLFFIGASFYSIGWEAFSDFPTVKRLLTGRSKSNGIDTTSMAEFANGAGPLMQSFATPNKSARQQSWSELQPQKEAASSEPDAPNGTSPPGRTDSPLSPRFAETSEDDWGAQMRQNRPINGKAGAQANGAHWQANGAHGMPRKNSKRQRRVFHREATLLAPLLGLIFVTLATIAVTAACQLPSVSLSCESSDFMASFADPTGRLNRGMRFALFVSFMQWAGQFLFLFPTWHRGLLASAPGKIWSLVAMPLWPLGIFRFLQWSFIPAGTGITQYIMGSLPHHVLDMGIILLLKVWMLVSCILVLKQPELSGFDRRGRLFEDEDWREMTTLFKYTFMVPTMLHFARGCMKFGVVGAQNDLLIIVCVYPLLLVTIWTLVWAVVVAPKKSVLLWGVAGSLSLASSICSIAGSHQVAATGVVWLHLMRQFLKLFRPESEGRQDEQAKPVIRRSSLKNAMPAAMVPTPTNADLNGHTGSASESDAVASPRAQRKAMEAPERRWARAVISVSALIALSFASTLAGLSAVSSIQQKIDWYPNTIWFEKEESPATLRVDHTISRLRLQLASNQTESRKQSGVSYSVCSHKWYGLSVLDYALLSLASYFDHGDPSLPQLLEGIFPNWTGLQWRLRNRTSSCSSLGQGPSVSRLSWLEVEVQQPGAEKPLLIIALRGTDPVRVSDYIEDIRMWTEPVALSILSTVFPTVRVWPRRTVEMVITGIHDFLGSLGMPNDSWSYTELVNCISKIPRDQYEDIVLTGHSLGGGMATVVAALIHLPVVSITPPGIYWSIAKHYRSHSRLAAAAAAEVPAENGHRESEDPSGFNVNDIASWMHHQSLTLVVENDWVNGIFDDHGGLVQMMTCDRSQESLELACHMLEGTICHLFNRCGDPQRRWDACAHEYVLKDTMMSTATKLMREASQVLPSRAQDTLFATLNWGEQPIEPGSRIFGNAVALLVIFFVALPVIGGAIEELFLL